MPKYDECILHANKQCTDCGECDKCDLDPNKICDSCGECLQKKDYDMTSVRVDEILDDDEDVNSLELEEEKEFPTNYEENNNEDEEGDIPMEFIDDIDGLRDILEDKEKCGKYTYEEFPGLIRIKKQK